VTAGTALPWLGAGLLAAMFLRLAWLRWRTPRAAETSAESEAEGPRLPSPPVWFWAVLSAGLPLALPFVARSIASQAGDGVLATFNYAWKLVELPLVLAIQLVAALAFPAIAKAEAAGDPAACARAVRSAVALAWALACAAAAVLLVGAPAIAQLLFGWGRMDPRALARVAQWGTVGAWGLLPQAVIAVGLTMLAVRGGMRAAVGAYGLALAVLLWLGARGMSDGAHLMLLLNVLYCIVAVAVVGALGTQARSWLPWRSMGASLFCLIAVAGFVSHAWDASSTGLVLRLALAALAGLLVMGASWWSSGDLRAALAR
jgi:putative peptidoglycan lipid II flippase